MSDKNDLCSLHPVHHAALQGQSNSHGDQEETQLALRHGLVSRQNELTYISEIEEQLNKRDAAGLLPISSTVTYEDWTFGREGDTYVCTFRQPVETQGRSLYEAYDEARYKCGAGTLSMEELDDCISDDDHDDYDSDRSSTSGMARSPEAEHNVLDYYKALSAAKAIASVSAEEDTVDPADGSRQVQSLSDYCKHLRATVDDLTAQLQLVKATHQTECEGERFRGHVDAEYGARITIDVDHPSRNTRASKRMRGE
jgi:hypothetical protein